MQPNESYSVSRRTLDVEDYIDIVRRHKGWIFGPFLFAIVASVVGVYLWPDTYISQAVIKITPQQVPESMVQSSINQAMYDRINSMEQTILSRNVLTTIINTYDLYKRERSRTTIEDVIDEMKKNIHVFPVPVAGGNTGNKSVPAFVVTFSYDNRFKARDVVQDLTSKFIDQNIRDRSSATFQTTQFMKDELEQDKKQLDEVENKLASFRMANNGRLPDQAEANLRQMAALQAEVSGLDTSISRANQEKLQMEATLRIMKDNYTAFSREPQESAAASPRKDDRVVEAENEVRFYENQLSALRQKYSENYPDVQTTLGLLAAAKQKRDDLQKQEAAKKAETKTEPAAPKPVNPQLRRDLRELDVRIRQLQSAIEGKDMELADYHQRVKRANEALKFYQARLETVPLGEKQYGELLRDREIAKLKYIDMETKVNRAQVAQQMELRKQGETLELLDPASLPTTQTEPKRPLIISMGAGLGLLLGIVIAGAREMKDTSLKNLKDVRAYTQMSILGSIPLLENDFVLRRRRRLAWLGWTTACLAAVVIMSGSIVYYYISKP